MVAIFGVSRRHQLRVNSCRRALLDNDYAPCPKLANLMYPYLGLGSLSQPRFRLDGVIETSILLTCCSISIADAHADIN